MSDTRGNEQDPLPASPGRRAKGTGAGKGANARSTAAGDAAAARGRGPGRPAERAEAAGRTVTAGRTVAKRIGIRELRQQASVYVDLAEKGYTVDITNRGRLVAQLIPVREPGSPLERLIAAGIIEPAEEPGGIAGLEPYPSSLPEDPE
jgi:antitoxin (DNA-binding transcriptional repressor) of toxin-antitoxin stability system